MARRGRGRHGLPAGVLVLAGLVPIAAAASPAAPAAAAPARDAWSLYRALMDAGEVDWIVPAGVDLAAVRLVVRKAEESGHLKGRIEVVTGDEAIAAGGRGSRVVLGSFQEAPARELAEHMRIEPMPRGFRYEGRAYVDDLDAVVATFEDPARPGRPVTLVFGNEPARLVPLLEGAVPGWRPRAVCYVRGELERAAPLGPGQRWLRGEERSWAGLRIERRGGEREVRLRRLILSVPEDAGKEELEAFAAVLDAARARFLAWAAPEARVPVLEVVVHTHPEDMGALLGVQDLAWYDPMTERVHALLVPGLTHDGGAALARAAAVATLGPPRDPWLLDAVGVSAAGKWWDRPLAAWVGWLRRAEVVPTIEELVDPSASERLSPHVVGPLRAVLFESLASLRGRDAVLALWRGERTLALDDELRGAFAHRVDAAYRRFAGPMEELAAERLRLVRAAGFRHGIAFTREGDPLAGYASRGATVSLARAASHGADALALGVEGYQEPGFPVETLRSSYGGRPASDTDVALAYSIAEARRLGLRPLLQPQLLGAPWGGLAGARVMPDLEDWEAFFAALEPFLVHYALLAELTGCEIYSVGGDLPSAAGVLPIREENEDAIHPLVLARQELKRRGWERIVGHVRRCFSGGLTYASWWNGGRVSFAPQLDFLGRNLFETLVRSDSGGVAPAREQLVRRVSGSLAELAEDAADEGCGAIVTSVGFTSTERTWMTPAAPHGELDLDAQRAMYEVLAEALRRQAWREDRLAGLYVWKWSTEPEAGGHGDRGFTPQNKPAEDVLDELFGVF